MDPLDRDRWIQNHQERNPFDYLDPEIRRQQAIEAQDKQRRQDYEDHRRAHAGEQSAGQGSSPLKTVSQACLLQMIGVVALIVLVVVFAVMCSAIGKIPVNIP